MKLAGVAPGDFIVYDNHPYRVLRRDVEIASGGLEMDPELMESLGVAVGKGNSNPKIHFRGRTTWERKGVLTQSARWGEYGQPEADVGGFYLFCTGHGVSSVADYLENWEKGNSAEIRFRGYAEQQRAFGYKYAAISNPQPATSPYRDRPYSDDHYYNSNLLYPGPLMIVKGWEFTDDEVPPWIGPEAEKFKVVSDEEGNLFRVRTLLLVCDSYNTLFSAIADHELATHTQPYRTRLTQVLVNVANEVEADPSRVSVTDKYVQVPHEVLEALVLGHKYGASEVVDYLAILRDEVMLFRGEDPDA